MSKKSSKIPENGKRSLHNNNPDHSGTKSQIKPVLAISMGDKNGVGPEVILKTLHSLLYSDKNNSDGKNLPGFLLFACPETMSYYAKKMNLPCFWQEGNLSVLPEQGIVHLIPLFSTDNDIRPGEISASAGELSMLAIKAAADSCLDGNADALITAPISKEAINLAGYQVPGHTEFLAECTGSEDVGMMLVNDSMRIGLATIHIPLRDVPAALHQVSLEKKLRLFHHSLVNQFSITSPRIAVLGLNPHAGDGGVIGTEEIEIISPIIRKLKAEGLDISGPWPSDGFFGSKSHENVDMIMAMYHDQGLIPLKLTGFGSGVNMTVGLPIIRTSPDHGTAFSIAGRNQADAGSMKRALHLAWSLAVNRDSGQKKTL